MKSVVRICRRSLTVIVLLPLFTTCLGDWGWGKRGDVDLSKATWLVAEKVPLITEKGGIVGGGTGTPSVPINNLFKLSPGSKVDASSLGGAIDPTGTSIINDFDGDGILNENETTTNVWIADYPMVESVIAPPVTLKVALLQTGSTQEDSIESEINSDDFDSAKSEGTEKIHQSELNLRTVQFQDQFSASIEAGGSVDASLEYGVKAGVGPVSAGLNFGVSYGASWESKNALATTTTKWADRPFKNNLDSDSLNLKANSSSQKARKYRSEKATKSQSLFEIKPNAGYVRAALYIKNGTVNMPVKLRNILCSLMFESPTGELIPVKSFRLLNGDGSTFEIEVYGGTEFGPYVIELEGLNTNEVQRAIASGYNPKIYIVDYEMTHVKDSNYRSALLNFSGDNLKVIEENAKGRTGLVKVIGPNIREMYRITAFDVENPNNADICKATSASKLVAGTTLEKALSKIACSGMEIEFENYVIDFSEIAPTLGDSKLYIRGIKSLAGIKTTIPCVMQSRVDSDGNTQTACVQKLLKDWTPEEEAKAGVWAVYSKGKYYSPTNYSLTSNSLPNKFDAGATTPAFMVKGVGSTIWAGDTYDIVYVSIKDLANRRKQFGTNPLETEQNYRLNTAWDLTDLGNYPYDPDNRSLFLGDAGFGETVQLQIKLDNTNYLNPSFGTPRIDGQAQYFTDFYYNGKKANDSRYDLDQVLDLEMSLGFGGSRTDWMHVRRDVSAVSDPYKLTSCGKTLDYTTQSYFLCLRLPSKYPNIDETVSLIKLYIRPALNSAYRRTAWPLRYDQVRKVQATLYSPASPGDTSILVTTSSIITDGGASFTGGDSLKLYGDSNSYVISSTLSPLSQSCEPTNALITTQCTRIYLNSPIVTPSKRTSSAYVLAGLMSPQTRLTLENGFLTDWNSQYSAFTANPTPGLWDTPQYLSLLTGNGTVTCGTSTTLYHPNCLGLNTDFNVLNWIGNYNLGVARWNAWADGGSLSSFLSVGAPTLITTSNKVFRLEAENPGVNLSKLAPTPNAGTDPILVNNFNGQALSLWKSGSNLIARSYNTKNSSYGPAVTINSSPLTGKFVAKTAKDGEILVIYDAQTTNPNDTIYVHRVQIDSGSTITVSPASALVTNRSLNGSTSFIDIAAAGTFYLVVWNSGTVSGTNTVFTVKGKIVTIAGNGNAVGVAGTDVTIPTTAWTVATSATTRLQVIAEATSNTRGIVGVAYAVGTASYGISTTSFDDLNTAGLTGVPPAMNAVKQEVALATAGNFSSMSVGGVYTGTNYRGYVSWSDVTGNIYGRGIDLDTGNGGAMLGASNTTIDNATGGVSANLKLTFSSLYNTALLTYSKGTRVIAKTVNLPDATVSTLTYLDSSTNASTRKPTASVLTFVNGSIPKAVVLWEHTDAATSRKTIRGRILNLSSGIVPEGNTELLVSSVSDGDQIAPAITEHRWMDSGSINRTQAFISWFSGTSTVYGYNLNLANPSSIPYGVNNFFVSPLVERDYTIKAKITF
ncbi:hypothetical protein EHQ27_17345 [Leptospira wolffii]|uniref:LIC12048 family lipoprotein n=1 Tax=Leptospira wolffii TaxID=409998 RepID=UPI0010823E7C|nr:LIC12048 family lipoprotein [Leptospira wolffii]TGK61790.1 hypothetical protein EHQ32_02750 [Leptospira wolffii]TGK66064.1 hypothetical protein EHQ27_17345 [Leptospira wolffii]TGK74825.1 hypothetical protein EHQ35_11030 [Leptospira wolffii]TGL30891.1 hypothetical protein EHQ57_05645 [Leptospira wolffii]